MNGQISMDKYHSLWLLLHQTQEVILKNREKELMQYGISTAESRVLFVIKNGSDNVTPADIARWTLREGNSVSTLLTRMEKKGLIKRYKEPNRKNIWKVILTKKGENAYNQSLNRKTINSIMSILSEDEYKQLESILNKLRTQAFNQIVIEQLIPFTQETILGSESTNILR